SKVQVAVWLEQWFGWKRGNVIDLGDITAARAAEMFLPLWVRLYGLLGTPHFNINVVGGRPGVGRPRRPRQTEDHAGPSHRPPAAAQPAAGGRAVRLAGGRAALAGRRAGAGVRGRQVVARPAREAGGRRGARARAR